MPTFNRSEAKLDFDTKRWISYFCTHVPFLYSGEVLLGSAPGVLLSKVQVYYALVAICHGQSPQKPGCISETANTQD